MKNKSEKSVFFPSLIAYAMTLFFIVVLEHDDSESWSQTVANAAPYGVGMVLGTVIAMIMLAMKKKKRNAS